MTTVWASPPAVKFEQGDLVSLSQANNFYGTSQTHTNGLGLGYTPQEIIDLAVSLGANRLPNDEFVENVYGYVKYNVETEFRYGLSKGGFGAMVDQSGTPFDQADLMVKLLQQGGVSAKYQLGNLTLNASDFGKWSGHIYGLNESNQTFTVSASATCHLLANGGIPASINGTTKADCNYSTSTLTSVSMRHLWVLVGNKVYDPSYVKHRFNTGIDLSVAASCGAETASLCGSQARTAALTGSTQLTENSMPYVKNVQELALNTKLKQYAISLQHTFENAYKNLEVWQVLGGKKLIDPDFSKIIPSDSGTYINVGASWNMAVPDQHRTKLIISFNTFNELLYVDEINTGFLRYMSSGYVLSQAGDIERKQRLVFEYMSNSGPEFATINRHVIRETNYSIDNIPDSISISVDHPYVTNGGNYADETMLQRLPPEGPYVSGDITIDPVGNRKYRRYFTATLFNSFGRTGDGRRELVAKFIKSGPFHFQGALSVNSLGIPDATAYPVGVYQVPTCSENRNTPYLTENRQRVSDNAPNCAILGTVIEWQTQYRLAQILSDSVMATTTIHHHSIGGLINYEDIPIYRAPGDLVSPPARWVGDPLLQINIVSTLATSSRKNVDSDVSISSMLNASLMSLTENGALRQAEDNYITAGTLSLFRQSNLKGLKFFKADKSRKANLLASTYNFIPNVKNKINEFLDFNDSDPQKEFTVIVPQNGVVGPIWETGGAAYQANLSYNSNAFFAFRKDGFSSAYINGNGDKGTNAADENLNYKKMLSHIKSISSQDTNGNYSLNPIAGKVSLSSPEISVGAGSFPAKLDVTLNFDQHAVLQNFGETASIRSNGAQAFGVDSILDASAMLSAIITLRDLYRERTGFKEELVAIFVGIWAEDQLMHNTVNVSNGDSKSTFVRLPDGFSYNPPNLSLLKLTKIGGEPWATWESTLRYSYINSGIGFKLENLEGQEWFYGDMLNSPMTYGNDPSIWRNFGASISRIAYPVLPTTGRELPLRLWRNANGEKVNYFSYDYQLDENGANKFAGLTCPDDVDGGLGALDYLRKYITTNYGRGIKVCYDAIWPIGIITPNLARASAGEDADLVEYASQSSVTGQPGTIKVNDSLRIYNAESGEALIKRQYNSLGIYIGGYGKYFLADGSYFQLTFGLGESETLVMKRDGLSDTNRLVGLDYDVFDHVVSVKDADDRISRLYISSAYGPSKYRRVEQVSPDGVSVVTYYNEDLQPILSIGAPYE